MKTELLEKLKRLLETEDISSVRTEVKELKSEFKQAIAKEKQMQQDVWNKEPHDEADEYIYVPGPENDAFFESIKNYEERINELNEKAAEEQVANLKVKKEILAQLEAVVENEKNIGKAFQEYNLLNEKWKAIGDVPREQYQKLNGDYQRLREFFFYNINIYKDLKDYDLKINLKRKEDLISKAKALGEEKSIKKCEVQVKQLQKEWNEIGSSPKETYKEIGDTFFGAIRNVYDKIQKYYEDLRKEMEANLVQKKEILEEIKQLVEADPKQHQDWTKKTEKVIALQEKWRSIGFAKKKENEIIWQEFRKLCDLFFERKRQFYALRNEGFAVTKKKKEELIEKAKELQGSEDWKNTTIAFMNLQRDWKTIGSTFQKDDYRLWQQFKTICDGFFTAKKETLEKSEVEQTENLKIKQNLIEEIKAFTLSENVVESIQQLKDFSAKWTAIGQVPERKVSETNTLYSDALNRKFMTLIESGEKNSNLTYEQKIELLKSAPQGERFIEREALALRKKIEGLQQEVNQYENNMGFFAKSSGSQALKNEIMEKVKAAELEIQQIKKQLQLLR